MMMECSSNTKPMMMKPNNSSNISEIVCNFAKVCTLKSIGVFYSESPNLHHLHHTPTCNDNNAPLIDDTKIHPHPTIIQVPKGGEGFEITKVFDAISALKLAYLELQQAHVPYYDPQKVTTADERVGAEIEKLCRFKVEYKEKQCRAAMLSATQYDLLQSEIKAKEAILVRLKSRNTGKDSKILRLRQELHDLEMVNKNLAEKIKRMSKKREASVSSVAKFQDVFKAASKSVHDFAKPLISLMKASGWELDAAAKWIENEAVYSKRCDKKYAFEAYIARRMFHGASLKSCDVGDVVKFDDPIDALMENPDSDFSEFCRTKYLLVVHPTMEDSFFGNSDHRNLVSSGKHPRTEFYQLFAKMAKWVWVLLRSAASLDPNAAMFYVERGSVFSSLYLESVDEEREIAMVLSEEERAAYKVQFMIMPGFRIGQTLVKSLVYVSKQS